MVDISKYGDKTPAEIYALGGTGPEAKAAWKAQGGTGDFGDVSGEFRKTGRESATGQETQKFKDWTGGASGFSDVYREGRAGEVKGPEHGIDDVDIYGYPSDWTVVGVEGGQNITKPGYGTYFKPTQEQHRDGGGGDTTTGGGGVVVSGAQPFDLPSLTDDMDLSNAISSLLNQNSPLFKAAGTAAMQRMAKRGGPMLNSSLAFGEVERAIIDVAMPIAKAEVDNLIANLNKRSEWTNAQRKQANDYVFAKMLKDIDNAAAMKLGLMKEEFGLAKAKVAGTASIMGEGGDIPLADRPGYWKEYMDMISGITGTA